MRSMARLEDGSDQALVEAKAVDAAYPLYGELVTEPALSRDDLFGETAGVFGAAAPDLLFERLGIQPGARIKLGRATFELRAKLVSEPDAVSDGFGFAPRLLLSLDGLAASGLVQPGSLVEHAYKISASTASRREAQLTEIREQAGEEFPEAGWSDPHAPQRGAGAVVQHRALLAIPDAGRPDRRWWSAASASPMRCAPISTASAASSPPSRASARRAASSSRVYLIADR